MSRRNEYKEVAGDVNFGLSQGTKVAIVIFVLVLVLGGLSYVIKVAVSGPKGQADAYAQKNSAENWTKAQAEFNRRYQSIQALDKNINQSYKALERNPDETRRQIEYDGIVRNCNLAVADYNTLSRSYLAEQFRDADLPYQIDDSDPSTDCKESN